MERKSYNKCGWRLLKGSFSKTRRGVKEHDWESISADAATDKYLNKFEERKEIKRDGKKNDHLSISFC
jgi:hypothetical protein